MSTIRITNWAVVGDADSFTAPELIKYALTGIVTGHPKKEDGERVITSWIVGHKGRRVNTYSGSVYTLGSISPKYRKFLKKKVPNWNWRDPLNFKRG